MPFFYRLRNGRKFEVLPCVLPVVRRLLPRPRRAGGGEETKGEETRGRRQQRCGFARRWAGARDGDDDGDQRWENGDGVKKGEQAPGAWSNASRKRGSKRAIRNGNERDRRAGDGVGRRGEGDRGPG